MNKKSISGIIAVILMIAAAAYAGFTNNTDKPVETQNTASQSYIEGETYTYNVPGETDFTSGEEDGDDVYYLASTNELVIVSTDGYIRTYFCPDSGKEYYDKQ